VIVLPEFDIPAHASFGWDWGKEAKGKDKNLVLCKQKEWADGNWTLAAEPPSGKPEFIYYLPARLFFITMYLYNISCIIYSGVINI
jgi:hypothetical protein